VLPKNWSLTAQDVVATPGATGRGTRRTGVHSFGQWAGIYRQGGQKPGLKKKGMKTLYIEPGAPWQNAYSESFNARFRDEFLNVELFASGLEAKVLGREHRDKYNHYRPHSSLGELTPAEFAARCLAPLRPTALVPPDNENITNNQPNLS